MFNPLVDDFSGLNDNELELKISELGRKYFQTNNPQVKQQIANILDMYKSELRSRNARKTLEQNNQAQDDQNGLDNLINIS